MDFAMRECRLGGTMGAGLGSALRRHWRLACGGVLLLAVAVTAVLLTGFHGGRRQRWSFLIRTSWRR